MVSTGKACYAGDKCPRSRDVAAAGAPAAATRVEVSSIGELLQKPPAVRALSQEPWSGLEVTPSESLADTAAQNGVVGIKAFREHEKLLYDQHGLRPTVSSTPGTAVGVGGRAKVLGRVRVPCGIGGVNGLVEWTIIDNPAVPPLTPVNLLRALGTGVNLPDSTMELRRLNKSTALKRLPTGHVSHSLTEFAAEG